MAYAYADHTNIQTVGEADPPEDAPHLQPSTSAAGHAPNPRPHHPEAYARAQHYLPEKSGGCTSGISKCCGQACRLLTRLDRVLLCLQAVCIAISLGNAGVILLGKRHMHEQCILSAYFGKNGNLEYGDDHESFWCDTSLYYSFASATLLFTCMMIHWTAQLNGKISWLAVQLIFVSTGLLGAAVATCLLITGFVNWCGKVQSILQILEKTTYSCQAGVKRYDEGNYKSHVKLNLVFNYTIIQITICLLCLIVWLAILAVCAMRLHQERHNQQPIEEDDENSPLNFMAEGEEDEDQGVEHL